MGKAVGSYVGSCTYWWFGVIFICGLGPRGRSREGASVFVWKGISGSENNKRRKNNALCPAPCALRPVHALRPATCALRPAPCALRPAPCALRPAPCALRPAPCALRPAPCARVSGAAAAAAVEATVHTE